MQWKSRAPIYWGHHFAITAAYTGTYDILRNITLAHLVPTAGLRLICLLLVPRRYWTALVIGEALPVAAMAITTVDRFGPAYGMISSLPPIVLCMPIVAWFTQYTRLKRPDGNIDINGMWLAVALSALATTVASCASILLPRAPDGGSLYHIPGDEALAFFLGYYLGALTLVSACLALRERHRALGIPLRWHHVRESRLFRDVLFLQIPLLAFILIYAHVSGGGALVYGRMATLLPLLMLAARHHWHGAAIGGTLSVVALMFTASDFYDPSLVPAQTVIAFTMTTCMVLGSGKPWRSTATDGLRSLATKWRRSPAPP